MRPLAERRDTLFAVCKYHRARRGCIAQSDSVAVFPTRKCDRDGIAVKKIRNSDAAWQTTLSRKQYFAFLNYGNVKKNGSHSPRHENRDVTTGAIGFAS
jgi:hypothetical protein